MNKPQQTKRIKRLFLIQTRIAKRIINETFVPNINIDGSLRLDFPKLVNDEID
jgi:hypothetical protein